MLIEIDDESVVVDGNQSKKIERKERRKAKPQRETIAGKRTGYCFHNKLQQKNNLVLFDYTIFYYKETNLNNIGKL